MILSRAYPAAVAAMLLLSAAARSQEYEVGGPLAGAKLPPDEILPGADGMTAAQLLAMIGGMK